MVGINNLLEEAVPRQRLVSGIRPAGRLHLGNYFGAIRDHVDLQYEYVGGTYYFIADLHELTGRVSRQDLRRQSIDVALDYLALGLDESFVTLYRQSDVPQTCELQWVLACALPHGILERGVAFKDAKTKGKQRNVGLFLYPLLMAADILVVRGTHVPVGADQSQNLEITRDAAAAANQVFGASLFPLPEIRYGRAPSVRGTDGKKMSRSYGNEIPIFCTQEELVEIVNSIITSPAALNDPLPIEGDVCLELYELVASEDEILDLKKRYQSGTIGFAVVKEMLSRKLWAYFEPYREARAAWERRRDDVEDLLRDGARRARDQASQTMAMVRDMVGLGRYLREPELPPNFVD